MSENRKEKTPPAPITTSAKLRTEKKMEDKFKASIDLADIRTVADVFVKREIIPGLKKGALKFLAMWWLNDKSYVDKYLGGNTKSYKGGSNVDYCGYSSYRKSDISSERVDNHSRVSSYNYGNIYLPTRGLCEETLAEMSERIRDFREATVADLFSICGISRPGNHTDPKWGWRDARAFHYTESGDEWLLDFDPPEFLGD